jgi:hypothetical protein
LKPTDKEINKLELKECLEILESKNITKKRKIISDKCTKTESRKKKNLDKERNKKYYKWRN